MEFLIIFFNHFLRSLNSLSSVSTFSSYLNDIVTFMLENQNILSINSLSSIDFLYF